jgi:hypothetical protein
MKIKKLKEWFVNYINQPAVTSFGDNIYLPLWKSVLADYACILTLGIYKPRKRKNDI